ncbi:MAG TPA: zinc-dependent alcohol dehydrogenase family protein [Candidatus Cybelea sp.]|nr:zinc-dependent alcohol dehydrogenase family protein [Candidatus Cybelea sp.]
MKACLLERPLPIESNPLEFTDRELPEPGRGEVRIRVGACGVCRTDLHVIEGELPPRKSPIIPGHQVVGRVDKLGEAASGPRIGERVGIPWLHQTDQSCPYCRAGRENLCDHPSFTGYTVDGGYAEYAVAPAEFVYRLPEALSDEQVAPLLCAGIIGFRCLRLAGVQPGNRLGLYGFGAAAHVAIQVALHWGVQVYAATRGKNHQQLAKNLGAAWVGEATDDPPAKLDAAILFAPAGELVPPALRALRKGGALILGGIHMSPIPSFSYDLLYQERSMRSVANNTRQDGRDFLELAAQIPVRTEIQTYPLREANRALNDLKSDRVSGAAVLDCRA